jgi:hypothetical protein
MGKLISFKNKKAEASLKKMDKAERSLKIETDDSLVEVEEGHSFLRNLKKEAIRQKNMAVAKDLMKQTFNVEFLPTVEAVADEITLAESFCITEED